VPFLFVFNGNYTQVESFHKSFAGFGRKEIYI
jgi:hypothetical protein